MKTADIIYLDEVLRRNLKNATWYKTKEGLTKKRVLDIWNNIEWRTDKR